MFLLLDLRFRNKMRCCAYFFLLTVICFYSHHANSQIRKVELPPGFYAFAFQEDGQGRIWIGLSDGNISGGLGVFTTNKLSIVSGTDSIPTGSYHTTLKLPDGSIMFGGNILNRNGKSLLVWVSSMGIDTIQIPFNLSNPLINCMAIVNRRDIWIGTASGLLINRRGDWEWLTARQGLPANFISTIYQDFRGVIWVGTEVGIAYFLDEVLYRPEPGTPIIGSATQFYGDKRGYVWCGARFASEGISVFNGEIWDTFSGRHGLVDNSASVFFQDPQGNLWVGSCFNRSRGGVSVFDGRKWIGYGSPQFIAKPCVDAIAADSKGRVWLAGSLTHRKYSGITVFDGEKWFRVGASTTLPADRVIAFYLDSGGNLWISSFEGLFIVDQNFSTFENI